MESTPLPMGELAEQLNMLKLKETSLNDMDKEIEGRVPGEELDDELTAVEHYRDSIAHVIFRAEGLLVDACLFTAGNTYRLPAHLHNEFRFDCPNLRYNLFTENLLSGLHFGTSLNLRSIKTHH